MNDPIHWTQDLRNVAETARIDQLPTPHCMVWAAGVVTITVDTDHQQSGWILAMTDPVDLYKITGYSAYMGRIDGGTTVKVAVAADILEHQLKQALRVARS